MRSYDSCPLIFCTHELAYSSLPMLPHSGQSSELAVDQRQKGSVLSNLASAVVWHTRHRASKES